MAWIYSQTDESVHLAYLAVRGGVYIILKAVLFSTFSSSPLKLYYLQNGGDAEVHYLARDYFTNDHIICIPIEIIVYH